MIQLTWKDANDAVEALREVWTALGRPPVYGIPSGGSIVAAMLCFPEGYAPLDEPVEDCFVVDDIIDSGRTIKRFVDAGNRCVALFARNRGDVEVGLALKVLPDWVRFPWEHETGAEDAVVRLLQLVGEDPKRDGLRDTPRRVTSALLEMTRGYKVDVAKLLGTKFQQHYDEMIVLNGIAFSSLCEHHMLPFVGEASVGYLPRGEKIVGFSKVVRVVEAYASRLQVQERLTEQIAAAMQTHLDPIGVGVTLSAQHECIGCRGARARGVSAETQVLYGALRDDPNARQEYIARVSRHNGVRR